MESLYCKADKLAKKDVIYCDLAVGYDILVSQIHDVSCGVFFRSKQSHFTKQLTRTFDV